MSEVIADYVQENDIPALLSGELPVMIDCTASWCGPCKLVSPIMDQLASDYDGRAKVLKLDLDANKATAKQYGVKSIPAVLLFKNGELIETLVGVKSYEVYSAQLDALI
ncbi:MAG: thioredoxin domain-containing protein [Leptolyngbyaceae bacterium]|nr:thioredoxin domain-containing protein [Leptolyngbyaceae bacterium]